MAQFAASMGKRPDLSELTKGIIIGSRAAGTSLKEAAAMTNVSEKTVSRIYLAWKSGRGIASRKRNSGRKSGETERAQRRLHRIVATNRRQTTQQITRNFNVAQDTSVSERTIRRRLQKIGLRSCKPLRKPLISPKNKKLRLEWCRQRLDWTADQWKSVLWSDESRFTLFPTDGRARIWRKSDEALHPANIIPTVQAAGGSIMVWGTFSWHGRAPLVVFEGIVDSNDYLSLLKRELLPEVRRIFPEGRAIFQDDNAPIHRAKIVREWFSQHSAILTHLPWPPQSPDLNPIEHVWELLERRIRQRPCQPSSLTALRVFLQQEWHNIPDLDLQHLVESMPKRVRAVIAAKGGNTKY